MHWQNMEIPPPCADRYLVADVSNNFVGEARWQPRLLKWKFPSGKMAVGIVPTHWMPMPQAPEEC